MLCRLKKKLTYCIEEETTTFDVVVNISEPHLFSVQQLNIETVHIVLRDYSLQSSIFENESKFNLQVQQVLCHQRELQSAQILGNDVTGRIRI